MKISRIFMTRVGRKTMSKYRLVYLPYTAHKVYNFTCKTELLFSTVEE